MTWEFLTLKHSKQHFFGVFVFKKFFKENTGTSKINPNIIKKAPAAGLEPATLRLTVECSAIELCGKATRNSL